MDANLDADALRRLMTADGVIDGKPIHLPQPPESDEPQPIHPEESFTVHVKAPKLKQPAVEVFVEKLVGEDREGAHVEGFRATPCDRTVRIGVATVTFPQNLVALDATSQGAVNKLATLLGHACVQAYVALMGSDDEEQVAAARSMEDDS